MGHLFVTDGSRLMSNIEEALNGLRPSSIKTKSFPCPRCEYPVYFPIVVRKVDVDAFRHLIELASSYLVRRGIPQKIMNDIIDQINLERLSKSLEE